MVYLLALASAALYGAADFLGGIASRRASAMAIVFISQLAGLFPLALLIVLIPAAPSRDDFIWGTCAGLAGITGVALLYRALAVGTMSVVAPTTAVCAVVLPVFVEALRGERLPVLTQSGIALAIAAIVLVSQHDASTPNRASNSRTLLPAGIGLALCSGVAIGVFYLALAQASSTAGLWPLAASRGLPGIILGAIVLIAYRPLALPPAVLKIAIACGVVDMLANALYLVASRGERLSIVVTLASLYPASTVILARIVVGERLSGRQAAGIVCALVAVVMIVGTS